MAKFTVTSINKDGSKVSSYTISDGTTGRNIDKDEIVAMINNGEISNAKVQIYKEQVIVRVKDSQSITRSLTGEAIEPTTRRTSSRSKTPKPKKTSDRLSFLNAELLKTDISTFTVDDNNRNTIEELRAQRRKLANPTGKETLRDFRKKYDNRYTLSYGLKIELSKNMIITALFKSIEEGKIKGYCPDKVQDLMDNLSYASTYSVWYCHPCDSFQTKKELNEFVADLIKVMCKTYLEYIGKSDKFDWKRNTDCEEYIGWLRTDFSACFVQAYNMKAEVNGKEKIDW